VPPACLWGIAAAFQKVSAQAGLGPGAFLTAFGTVIVAAGLIWSSVQRESSGLAWTGVRYAVLAGLAYAIATGLISFTLLRFATPIAKLAPILGCNVLITAIIGIVPLGEGAALNVWKVIGGTIVVLFGLALVTTA
jgi:hypothetical protein